MQSGAALGSKSFRSYFTQVYGLKRSDVRLKHLKVGSRVIAGTILGHIGRTAPTVAPNVLFEIRPAGRGAPRIDPKPILDGWKLLESTAIYRAAGKNPFFGPDARNPSIGQVLMMSKEALQRTVLQDPRIDLYSCGRRDIRAGVVDRRVLATLEFLASSGLKPTVSALRCGHGYLTASGNVSEHSSGNAVDIAAINGIPILGHQGEGSITDITIRRLLTLQGTMKPHQIISLMTFDGADNTMALPDHADHIHVGFHPLFGDNTKLGQQLGSVLKPGQWTKLISRLGQIDNPTVRVAPVEVRDQGQAAAGPPGRLTPLFRFAQVELPWALGPADGRYVVRGHAAEPEHVVVLRTLGAPQRHRLRGRRAARRPSRSPPRRAVTTSRATVIAAEPFPRRRRRPSAGCRRADVPAEAAAAVAVLERVAAWQRLATADPRLPAPALGLALAARVGIGDGRGRRRGALAPRGRAAGRRARDDAGARAGATPPCARRSAWPPCWARATPRWPASSWRCGRATTSTPGGCARPPSSSTPPWTPRRRSSSRGATAATSAPRLDELAALREEAAAVAVAARSGGLGDDEAAFVARAARPPGGGAAGAHRARLRVIPARPAGR